MDNKNENQDDRYCSIQESIIESCKQVKQMRKGGGALPKKTWKELKEALQEIKNEDDDEQQKEP